MNIIGVLLLYVTTIHLNHVDGFFMKHFKFVTSFKSGFGQLGEKLLTDKKLFDLKDIDIDIHEFNARYNPIQHPPVEECDMKYYNFGAFPRLECANSNGQLTWYPIGFKSDFSKTPQRVTIRDTNYIVWRDAKQNYYGLRDCCSHQGASFLLGKTKNNTISCPYHGYAFDGKTGDLVDIPKLTYVSSCTQNIDCFKVVEKGDMVYLNTVAAKDEFEKIKLDDTAIFVEPEFYEKTQRAVFLSEDFEHYAKLVSVNSLDICHIGFVHAFGNKKSPNPTNYSKVMKLSDTDFHYKIVYQYVAGENSLVNKVYKFDNITVENEYVLPHTTVARVKFGSLSSTIITHALPISKFKTRLFVKAYRSYWCYPIDRNGDTIFYPVRQAINSFGDKITKNTMVNTLKEDKRIVDSIDKTDYVSMHGKFSILYDMFSNHYKNNYKNIYEAGDKTI
jgi:hypothetical protein